MQLRRVQHADQNVVEFQLQQQARPWRSWRGLAAAAAAAVGAVTVLLAAPTTTHAQVALLALVAAAVMASTLLQVTSEAVIVLQGVGVLLLSRRRCGSCSSRFIDRQDIHSVIINETLTTTNIHVHLAFLLYDSSSLAVAFPSFCPGLKLLVPLYRELHALLYD